LCGPPAPRSAGGAGITNRVCGPSRSDRTREAVSAANSDRAFRTRLSSHTERRGDAGADVVISVNSELDIGVAGAATGVVDDRFILDMALPS